MDEPSILKSIKKLLGVSPDSGPFDLDILMDINAALSILCQLGIGPATGFAITGEDETWEDFLGNDPRLNMVKIYVQQKVRLMFDTSTLSSAVIDALERSVREFEWRANVQVDPGEE